jgi:hypothetical protein
MLRVRMWAIVIVSAATARADGPSLLVLPTSGAAYSSVIVSADDKQVSLRTANATKQVAWQDLVRLGNFVEPAHGPLWLVGNGGQLVAEVESLADDKLSGISPVLGTVAVPLAQLHGWTRTLPADLSERDRLTRQLTQGTGDNDIIILANGDRLTGTLEAVNAEKLTLETPQGAQSVELDRVAAVRLNPSLTDFVPLPPRYWIVGLRDGTRLVATSINLADGKLQLETAFGKLSCAADELAAIQPFVQQVRFLSDLKPTSFKHLPYLQLAWPLQTDANVLGQPLRVDDAVYLKGLGVHTAARASYTLDKPYRQFQAELAIDNSAGGNGSAVCSVFVDDGSGKWHSRYTSPIIRGGMDPVEVRVDLTGAKAISLLTDFADNADILDHVDWLDARLVE